MKHLFEAHPDHDGKVCIRLINLPDGLEPLVVSLGAIGIDEHENVTIAYDFPFLLAEDIRVLNASESFYEYLTMTLSYIVNESLRKAIQASGEFPGDQLL